MAIKPTGKKQGHYTIWLFQCDCGNTVEKTTKHLSDTSSCGCAKYESLRKDFTGQKFGRLTALWRCEDKPGESIWHFKCECGNEVCFPISRVKAGTTNSCGCLRKEKSKLNNPYLKDLSDKTFGYLKVVGLAEKEAGSIERVWLCECVCGKQIIVQTRKLTQGEVRSCGCLEDSFYCVYRHIFPDGRIYIGKTSRHPRKRWFQGRAYESQSAIEAAINAIGGYKEFQKSVVHQYFTKQEQWETWNEKTDFYDTNIFSKEQANNLEQELIRKYSTTESKFGLNSSSGGDFGFNYNEETVEKNRAAQKAHPSMGFKGKHLNKEAREILSQKAKERAQNGQVNFKGQHHSAESKEKLRQAKLGKYDGEKNPFYGHKHTQEVKDKISERSKKPVSQYDTEGKLIRTFPSVSAAAQAMNTTVSNISASINGKGKIACGFVWKHIEAELLPEDELPKRKKQGKPIACYDLNGNLITVYDSLKDAAEALGVSCTSISSAAKGKTHTSGGYKWAYLQS